LKKQADMPMNLHKVDEFQISPVAPYSFKLTIQKDTRYGTDWYWLTPFESYHQEEMRTAVRLSDKKPVGLKIKSLGNLQKPKILVKVFAEMALSKNEKQELKGILMRCLGSEVDIREFYLIANQYPVLSQAVKDLYGARKTSFPDVFSAMILAVTLQMTSYGRTQKMIRLLCENYGELLKFDGEQVLLWPSPFRIADTSEEELRQRCKLGFRAKYLKVNSEMIISGKIPSMEKLEAMSPEIAQNMLKQMSGVGDYSAGVISPHPSFPVDVWSVHIFAHIFHKRMTKQPRAMIAIIRELARRYFGMWQGYAYEYVVNDLENLLKRHYISSY
jgi:3-methyladenine DNA glycosylase/8-oxoguanine DNA glycosylase